MPADTASAAPLLHLVGEGTARYARLEAEVVSRSGGSLRPLDESEERPGGAWKLLRGALQAFLRPVSPERRRINRERWESLPAHLRTPQQTLGLSHVGCGATHGVLERCNFSCTSCYLSPAANAARPLPAEEVRAQLDALRAFLGPKGKAQLTAGEVTLLPREVLGSYVDHARRIGLDPMVMSHGERFLEEPGYLEALVEKHGLRKLAIHVDVTQRGRRGWKPGLRETALHPVRERYAELLRSVRRKNGVKVHAAHTVTVTEASLDGVADVTRWMVENLDAFRMVSFQPVAEVGRTRDSRSEGLTLDAVWKRICEGLGRPLNRHAMWFGHPECHIVAPVVVVRAGGEHLVLEVSREGKAWDRGFAARLMRALGGFSTVGEPLAVRIAGTLSLLVRNPLFVLEAPFYCLYRLGGERCFLTRIARALLRLRPITVRPLALVVHRFMNPEDLETPLGQERLAACAFQLPVEGRMVSMCAMNGTDLRHRLSLARAAAAGSAETGRSRPC